MIVDEAEYYSAIKGNAKGPQSIQPAGQFVRPQLGTPRVFQEELHSFPKLVPQILMIPDPFLITPLKSVVPNSLNHLPDPHADLLASLSSLPLSRSYSALRRL